MKLNRIIAAIIALLSAIVTLPAAAQVYVSTDQASFDKVRKGIQTWTLPFTSNYRIGTSYKFDTDPSAKTSYVSFTSGGTTSPAGLWALDGASNYTGSPVLADLGGDLTVNYNGPVLALFLAVKTSQTINYTVNNIAKSIQMTAGQTTFLGFDNGGHSSAINVVFDLSKCDSLGVLGFQTAVPEAATWAMMMIGLGATGASLRRRRGRTAAQTSFA